MKVGDIIKCKRCGNEFALEKDKLAALYCFDCKFIKDREHDRNYYNLYKRSDKKTGRPKK
jgi:late competence protein required for DNA uptake (superfamily II DNA/RNA helicase)